MQTCPNMNGYTQVCKDMSNYVPRSPTMFDFHMFRSLPVFGCVCVCVECIRKAFPLIQDQFRRNKNYKIPWGPTNPPSSIHHPPLPSPMVTVDPLWWLLHSPVVRTRCQISHGIGSQLNGTKNPRTNKDYQKIAPTWRINWNKKRLVKDTLKWPIRTYKVSIKETFTQDEYP